MPPTVFCAGVTDLGRHYHDEAGTPQTVTDWQGIVTCAEVVAQPRETEDGKVYDPCIMLVLRPEGDPCRNAFVRMAPAAAELARHLAAAAALTTTS